MLFIARNIILEREFLLNLKIMPLPLQEKESPFLVQNDIKNRQVMVLYKTVIRKGREGVHSKPEKSNRSIFKGTTQDESGEDKDFSRVSTIKQK